MNNFNTIQLYKDFITGFNNSRKIHGQTINGIIKIVVDIDEDNIINNNNYLLNTNSNVPLKFKLQDLNDLKYKSVSQYQKKDKPSFPFICDI